MLRAAFVAALVGCCCGAAAHAARAGDGRDRLERDFQQDYQGDLDHSEFLASCRRHGKDLSARDKILGTGGRAWRLGAWRPADAVFSQLPVLAELFRSFDTERDGYLNEHETYLLLVSINQGPENDDSDMDSTYNGIDHDGTPCSACLRPHAVHATNLWLCCSCALLKLMLWLLLPLLPRHRRCVAPCDRLNIQY